jgi:hypothetical protein
LKKKSPRTFRIHVRVDFGPVKRPAARRTLVVERGITPKDAVSIVFPIQSGKSCCSMREVKSIAGVASNANKKRWWKCFVNGKGKTVSPHRTRLKPKDVVEWKYIDARS